MVLTRVEGSEQLWAWDPAVMADAQRLHDAVLHARLRHWRGYAACAEHACLLMAAHHTRLCSFATS